MRFALLVGLALAIAGCDSTGVDAPPEPAPSGTVDIDPRQTYLRTASDRAVDAPAIAIEDLGLARGGEACFEAVGDYFFYTNVDNDESDVASNRPGVPLVTAVFGNSPGLEPASYALRPVFPINAGEDVVTPPTSIEDLPTDISQDFDATDTCVDVPANARYVFFSTFDRFFADNRNVAEGRLQVRVTSG
ncbi:MAG: hypothetical protein AAF845_05875 [Bacteroidota bacterium]